MQLVVPWKRQVRGEWKATEEQRIALRRNAEETWLGVVADIAGLRPGSEAELDAQFSAREQRAKTLAEIERLEKVYYKEKQMRRKCELHEKIQQLKETIQ